jgi:hypothetical protein
MPVQEETPDAPLLQIPRRIRAVGPGWHPVLLRLHEQLGAVCPDYRVVDVKEKFGGLRVYIETAEGSPRGPLTSLIRAAEADASVLCEFCGAPGRARSRGDAPAGWIKTVCDRCHRAWSARELMIVSGVVRPSGRGPCTSAAQG